MCRGAGASPIGATRPRPYDLPSATGTRCRFSFGRRAGFRGGIPGVVAESHDVGVQIGADRDPTRNKDLLQRINELRPIRPAIKVIMGRYFPGKGGGRLATT